MVVQEYIRSRNKEGKVNFYRVIYDSAKIDQTRRRPMQVFNIVQRANMNSNKDDIGWSSSSPINISKRETKHHRRESKAKEGSLNKRCDSSSPNKDLLHTSPNQQRQQPMSSHPKLRIVHANKKVAQSSSLLK